MDSWSCDQQVLPLYMNASAPVISESEKGNKLRLEVFSKSVVLRTKVSFNKSEVIALQVHFSPFCSLVMRSVITMSCISFSRL